MTLKQRVVTQVNRIKALQSSIQDQVLEMKRLEVSSCLHHAYCFQSLATERGGSVIPCTASGAPSRRKILSDLLRQIPRGVAFCGACFSFPAAWEPA